MRSAVDVVKRLSLLILLLALAGCRESESRRAPRPAQETPQPGGTLLRRFEGDVRTLNPVLVTTAYEKHVLSYLFDALVELDRELRVVPGIARSWSLSEDGRVWTFEIDPRARFSDGTPVRAGDVVFTIRHIAADSPQLAGAFSGLDNERTIAVDDDTARIAFDAFRAGQLYAFNVPILPEHVYAKGDFRNDFNETVVGSGPYQFVSREPGRQIILKRRGNYWRGAGWIDQIVFKVIDDDAVAWKAMKRGDVDETKINSDTWRMERNAPEVQQRMAIHRFYDLGYNFIPWNTRDPILSDVRVRRAMTMALDRKSIIENLYFGTARVITGPFTPDQSAYNPAVAPIPFDPEGAKELLAEAGWRDSDGDGIVDREGRPLELEMLLSSGNNATRDQAQVFQQSLQSIGVRLRLTTLDFASLVERVMAGKYQGTILKWDVDLDPDLYSLFHSSQMPPNGMNLVFYSNPEVDRLIEEARHEVDASRRTELYRRLHAMLHAEQPYTWIVQVSNKWAVNRRIRDVEVADGIGLFLWYPASLQWWIPVEHRRAGAGLEVPQ